MSALIVYYSQSGNTQRIAQEIDKASGADNECIENVESHAGMSVCARSGWEATIGHACATKLTLKEPDDYRTVTLGAPLWMMNLAPPMRVYLADNAGRFRKVAGFCAEGSAGGDGAYRQMARIGGKQPVALLIITEGDLRKANYAGQAKAFAEAIASQSDEPHAGTDTQISL